MRFIVARTLRGSGVWMSVIFGNALTVRWIHFGKIELIPCHISTSLCQWTGHSQKSRFTEPWFMERRRDSLREYEHRWTHFCEVVLLWLLSVLSRRFFLGLSVCGEENVECDLKEGKGSLIWLSCMLRLFYPPLLLLRKICEQYSTQATKNSLKWKNPSRH